MNTKKKIFSFGLYKEGMKQLKLVGILAFVILTLEAILIPVGGVIGHITCEDFDISKVVAHSVTGLDVHPLLITVFVLWIPIMAFNLFSFLDKRNTSDFYHSIPHTRACLFTSYFAAIITWLVILIVGTGSISIITHLIFSKFYAMVYSSMIMLMLNCLAGGILVAAAIAIAMIISGTLFNNVVVSGLILFLPRFIITLVSDVISDKLPMVLSDHLFPLFSSEYNVVTGYVFNVIEGSVIHNNGSSLSILTSGSAFLYTIILSVLYSLLACILFCKRESESAGRSAPNRIMQSIFRITVTMFVCTVICVIMFRDINDSYISFFGYVILYIIAIVVYFTYELITTKKWKNLLRAIPGLGIVALLNVALVGGMYVIYTTQLNYSPDADEIKSISIEKSVVDYYNDHALELREYMNIKNSSVKITDSDAIEVVADSLKENVENYKVSADWYREYYNNPYGSGTYYDASETVKYMDYTFKIQTDSGYKYRYVHVPVEKTKIIANALESNEALREQWMTLPEARNNTINMLDNVDYISGRNAVKLYESMCRELKNAEFDDWYLEINVNQKMPVTLIRLSTSMEAESYEITIPIYSSVLPETCKMYYDMLYDEGKKDTEAVKGELKKYTDDSKAGLNVIMYVYNSTSHSYEAYDFSEYTFRGDDCAKYLLEHIVDKPISINGSYAFININEYRVLVALDDIDIDDIPVYFNITQINKMLGQ